MATVALHPAILAFSLLVANLPLHKKALSLTSRKEYNEYGYDVHGVIHEGILRNKGKLGRAYGVVTNTRHRPGGG